MLRTLFSDLPTLFAHLRGTIFLDLNLANDFYLNDTYRLSICTGSLSASSVRGTIEVALMKDGSFFSELNGQPDYDKSCIGYMSFAQFYDMLKELTKADSDDFELIFIKYKTYIDYADEL